jgi:hypothetical protein
VAGGAAGQSVRTTSGSELLDEEVATLDELITTELDDDLLELTTELDAIELGCTELDGIELDGTELEAIELNTTTELLELRTKLDDDELRGALDDDEFEDEVASSAG